MPALHLLRRVDHGCLCKDPPRSTGIGRTTKKKRWSGRSQDDAPNPLLPKVWSQPSLPRSVMCSVGGSWSGIELFEGWVEDVTADRRSPRHCWHPRRMLVKARARKNQLLEEIGNEKGLHCEATATDMLKMEKGNSRSRRSQGSDGGADMCVAVGSAMCAWLLDQAGYNGGSVIPEVRGYPFWSCKLQYMGFYVIQRWPVGWH